MRMLSLLVQRTKAIARELLVGAVIYAIAFAPAMAAAQEKQKPQGTGEKTNAAAQTPDAHAPTGKTAESPVLAAEKSPGGSHEGIKVHGHWNIVVRNEDGSVAARYEFENALTGKGRTILAYCLTGLCPTPQYQILLNNTIGPITAATQAVFSSANDDGWLVLTGSVKAPSATQIVLAQTLFAFGPTGYIYVAFTTRDLTQPVPPSTTPPQPINVVAGQTIDVTVTINFS